MAGMHFFRHPLAGPGLGVLMALGLAWHVLASGAAQPPLGSFTIAWATVFACLIAGIATLRGRLRPALACMLQAGALATASSALGLQGWYFVFKPLAMLLAMGAAARTLRSPRSTHGGWLLLAALAASLAGDVFLMLHDLFLPGLASFLLAHLCYIALFKLGQRWFAHRSALALALLVGAAVYTFLWQGGLPANMRLPVAAYVLVIALMAAQAWGRWHDADRAERPAALLVALGSCSFMLSDALLATNLFVQPLPWAQVGVLSSYYLAQGLIVAGMLQALTVRR